MQVAQPPPRPDLRALLQHQPQFHRLADIHAELNPELTSWNARMDVLLAMQAALRPGTTTLETGCGYSTVMFAGAGTDHWCVTPAAGETERVARFCAEHGLSTSRVHFVVANSEDALPKLDAGLRWDLVFIDGGHRFPIPCIDWYYAGAQLRTGGLLVLDDVRVATVRILFDFLRAESEWRLVRLIGDTAFFRKLREHENREDWLDQQYNRNYPDWSFLPPQRRVRYTGQRLGERVTRMWTRLRRRRRGTP